jgi:5-formyltetrahydrofolate cyclo-ligase
VGPIIRLPPDVLASEDLLANGRSGPATPAESETDLPSCNPALTGPDRPSLRRALRDARAAFVGALQAPVRAGFEKALAAHLPRQGPPGILGSYCAVGDEIDPRHLEQAAREAGWRIAFPRVTTGPLAFHETGRDSLFPGYRGLPEPPAGAPIVRPDALLVPLLGADRAGNRLGQGKGHYDRTLAALRAQGAVRAVGLAWDVQLADALPAERWDEPLDALATPTAFSLVALPRNPAQR